MKVVTDSTSDLPRSVVEEYEIEIVPLTVRLGNKVFKDYYDVSPVEFYEMLRETDDFPRTSQPSVEDFVETYRKIGSDEEIISIHISMDMSATVQSATIALQQLPGWKVKVIDSRLVSAGLGLLVLETAKAIREGAEPQEVYNLIDDLKSKIKVYFSVDSLDFLQKGGRIGKASAFLGAMMNIKPLLKISDGVVSPVERVRGTNRLIERMAEIIKQDVQTLGSPRCTLVCGESEENLSKLINYIADIEKEILYKTNVGCVITSHAGPTAFGIGYYCSRRAYEKISNNRSHC